jgi:hypothetical protein
MWRAGADRSEPIYLGTNIAKGGAMDWKQAAALVALTMAGAAGIGTAGPAVADNPPPDAKLSPDTAWLIIGIQPTNARIEVDEARMDKGCIRRFSYNMNAYHPVDGFIVVQVEPGKPYGIGASSLMIGKSIFGVRYKPDHQAPVFQGVAGKVEYIASISYRADSSIAAEQSSALGEAANYSQDLEGARAFLKAHYPGLSDGLEQGGYQMTRMYCD